MAGGLFPLESFGEEPGFARLLDGLRALGRVIVFDRRGVGLSDPIQAWDRTVLHQWTDDVAAVVEALGTRDVVLMAWEGFGVGSRYAAMHPERVSALVLYEPFLVAYDNWEPWVAAARNAAARTCAESETFSPMSHRAESMIASFATGIARRAEWAPARRRRRASGNR